jgi:hypothetical protein
MKKMLVVLILVLAMPTLAAAAAVKTYQVTGPVLEVTDSMIVVQKGHDRWELARDANTTVHGDLKVGNKVTIEYRMIATKVDVKEAKKAAEAKKPAAAKGEKKPAAPAAK